MKTSGIQVTLRIVLLYTLFGGIWVAVSDRILEALVSDPHILSELQTYKGWTFVIASALLLSFMVRRELLVRGGVERELKASEEKYRTLIETANDAIFVFDAETGLVLDANKKAEELFGLPVKEIIGRHHADLHPKEDSEQCGKVFAEALQGGRLISSDLCVSHRDGRTIPVEVSISVVSVGGRRLVQSIFRDITERKRAGDALEREKSRAQRYLDVAGVMLMVIGADQKVSLINKRGCEILGYDEEEIIGKNCFDTFIPKRNRDEVKETFKKLIAGEVEPVEYFENPVLTRNKDERIIAWHNTFLRDEDSKIIATLSSGEDITEHKKADEEIQKLNEELNQRVIELTMSNQDLDAFNYTVSHDLKVPLVIIGGFTNSFLKKHSDKLDTKEKDMFHAIRKHTQEMERLIKDLLAFSRAGRQKIKPTEIDMGNLITTILDELNPLSEGRMIKYDVKILPTAYGDQALIKQVFINLISNAIKFTTNKKMAVIEVGGWTEESENVYCVKDNGIGFSSQDSEKLFTVFQRLHGIEELEGSGVGLSIVQRIVKRHGGGGWAEGKGKEGG